MTERILGTMACRLHQGKQCGVRRDAADSWHNFEPHSAFWPGFGFVRTNFDRFLRGKSEVLAAFFSRIDVISRVVVTPLTVGVGRWEKKPRRSRFITRP